MNNYKISVIITIYNMEQYLDKCIQSVINQTYKNLEIILVNDGSTDESLNICNKYAALDIRFVVINKRNEGLVRARISGIKQATGDYITFVDADDWLDSNAYELVVNMSDNEDMITYGLLEDYTFKSVEKYDWIEEGVYKENNIKNAVLPGIFADNYFFGFNILPNLVCKFIKREILCNCINKVSPDVAIGEDLDFVVQSLNLTRSLRAIKICPYHYVQREKSMVRTSVSDKAVIGLYRDLMAIESDINEADWKKQVCTYMSFILQLKKMNLFIKNSSFFDKLKNKKVVVYGAGNYGRAFVEAVSEELHAVVLAIADSNWKNIEWDAGIIISPEDIVNIDFDMVYIAVLNENVCNDIKNNLLGMGVDENKIMYYGIKDVKSSEIKKILELIE